MKRVSIRSVAISCFLFAAPSFAAADKALCSSDDGSLVVFGDIGFAKIKAQEFFYVGDHEISQLNWESKGVTLFTVGVDGQIDNDWSLKGSVKVGTGGNGHVVDYDCKIPEHEDWSHRSIHPLTELDHYVAVAIELDRIINGHESSSIAVGAIPTSNGPRMAGQASIRTRRASEKASGRLQTGKEASATGKRFRWASSALAANTFSAILPSAAPFRVA